MGIITTITATTIVITTNEGQSDGNNYRSDRQSIDPVSELAVMVQGCRQLQSAGASVKKRMAGIMAKNGS
jgi:hypothetical protein